MPHVVTLLISGALLAGPAFSEDKDGGKKDRKQAKDAVEWRHRTEREKDRAREYLGNWPRETRGHVPHDNNGNGVVDRSEWPGDDNAFRKLDRNGDGILSDADRKLQPKRRVHR
ncbi:MAG TPA: hypothetical protein VES20_07115 [Bryobacteraceae bacterium]|nr:hypothetical protein [Bryobacteraceae bacterium]